MQIENKLHGIRELIAAHAKAKGERVQLEQFRKVKKALLMRDAENLGQKSAAMQERDAYANPEYLEVLDALKVATEEEARTFWELKLQEWKFEAWRTRSADARVELGRYK
jgi:hypothetical protein